MHILNKDSSWHFPDCIREFLISWLLGVFIEYLILPSSVRSLSGTEGLAQMSLFRILFIAASGFLFFQFLHRVKYIQVAGRWILAGLFLSLSFTALLFSFSWTFLVVCGLILIILIFFCIYGWDASPELAGKSKPAQKKYIVITICLAISFFLFVSIWTVCRYRSFCTPSYDFGIFAQMFYNMKKTGLPVTTLERDGVLSHFHVHVSPIYYLMLPLYWIFPDPATLQILQAAVLASAVIPLWKIGKIHNLSDLQSVLLCAVLLLFPAFSGGTGYDLHENCFLTPMILWLFYGIDKKNAAITAVSAVLTLMVKEDAAVYTAVIALWLILKTLLKYRKENRRELITGIVLLLGSLIWFFAVTSYLAKIGDGVMTYRYDNFMFGGSSSLFMVILSVILNPMKAIYECVDPEKLKFIAFTMLPLLGLPFITRRYERYLLIIPFMLVNLMSDYPYQHDIFFQYTFGSTACLLYLTAVNLSDLKKNCVRTATLCIAVIISAVCFCTSVVPKAAAYPAQCAKYSGYYQKTREFLSQIPDESSVTATTFYTAFLSEREVLYDVRYASTEHLLTSDYIVLDTSRKSDFAKFPGSNPDNLQNLTDFLQNHGYTFLDGCEEIHSVIYKKN